MGRGRTKSKKSSTSNYDDFGSGEEEKIPVQKKRGRPQKMHKDETDQKMHKDETDEEEVDKLVGEDVENTKTGTFDKQVSHSTATDNGKKRKSVSQGEEKKDLLKEGSSNGARSTPEEPSKLNGFRHIHHRRKNKPRRAAEAVVECR